MSATVLNIVEKTKQWDVVPAHLENFVLTQGDSIPADTVVAHPHTSLYCLDDENRRAIFVETPPEVDLSEAVFYYQTQYAHAMRLFAVSYDEFHALADTIQQAKVIFLHSTGRCGSTVISKALNTVEGVVSLSEPDVYTQVHFLHHMDKSREDEYVRLLKSCTAFYSRGAQTLVIKFRGMVVHIGALLHRANPDATNLFLYRHAETWAGSMGVVTWDIDVRRTPVDEIPFHWQAIAPTHAQFIEQHERNPTRVELTILGWQSMMDSYLRLREQGIPFLAARYEDIRAQPVRVLEAIFDYCGLPVDAVENAYTVFSKDSQEGTIFARDAIKERVVARLDDEDYAQMRAVLAGHPIINAPDYIAPDTLTLDAST